QACARQAGAVQGSSRDRNLLAQIRSGAPLLAQGEHAVPRSARSHERHRHVESPLHEGDVLAGGRRKAVRADLPSPPPQRLEDRTAMVEVALMLRKLLGLAP